MKKDKRRTAVSLSDYEAAKHPSKRKMKLLPKSTRKQIKRGSR